MTVLWHLEQQHTQDADPKCPNCGGRLAGIAGSSIYLACIGCKTVTTRGNADERKTKDADNWILVKSDTEIPRGKKYRINGHPNNGYNQAPFKYQEALEAMAWGHRVEYSN